MNHRCPQCGALIPPGLSCQELFDRSQLAELEQPAYYAVHHLSVPCYMLQHNAYAARGWLEVRALLHRFVFEDWTPAMARRHIQANLEGGRRNWSITRGPKLPGVADIVWTRTIADVSLETAEAYGADVRRWAAGILADSQELARRHGAKE